MNETFDLNKALDAIKAGAKIDGKEGVLAPLIKQLTEAALEAELETHHGNEIRNRKNGKSSKRMKSSVGEFELEVPRGSVRNSVSATFGNINATPPDIYPVSLQRR